MVEIDDSNMAVEVRSSPYEASTEIPPEDALGYSRHYAKKIHDLGKSSRKTWIETLVEHVLNVPNKPGKGSMKKESEKNESKLCLRGRRAENSVSFNLIASGNSEARLRDSPYLPPIKLSSNHRSVQPIQHSHRELGRDSTRDSGRDGNQYNRESLRRDVDAQSTTSTYKGPHYPPIKSAPPKEVKVKHIPTELANSPYVSNRQNFKIVPLEKIWVRMRPRPVHHIFSSTTSSSNHNHHSTQLQSSSHNQSSAPHLHSQQQHLQNHNHHHSHHPTHHSHSSNVLSRRPDGQGSFKPSHPYLSSASYRHEAWKPPPIICTQEMVNLEKKAKQLASKAIKDSKIFTCEGPYPVDAYVRFSLRKRGWVEKFAPNVLRSSSLTHTTSSKLECELDEDFDVICDRNIPAPWEEDNGLYAITSRLVRHRPARFIWGGRGVNSLVLHQEVIVNHFPKARTFSSKTGITSSLKELPWLASSDPHEFFPRCFLLKEDEREGFIEDFRLTACMALLKWVLSLFASGSTQDRIPMPERSKTIEIIHEEDTEPKSDSMAEEGKVSPEVAQVEGQDLGQSETKGNQEEDSADQSEKTPESEVTNENGADELHGDDHQDDDLNPDADDPDFNLPSDEDSDSDHVDAVSLPVNSKGSKREGISMFPELLTDGTGFIQKVKPKISYVEKCGGEIPSKAVDWALSQCERYIKCRLHEDLDEKMKPSLTTNQWSQFLKWFYRVAYDGATVSVTQSKVQKVTATLKQMKKLWPQYDIDGMRNLWILKPGGKSKGIGIEFCNNLDDIMKYMTNSNVTNNYVIQKYIETPLLLYNTKFDIRQWFIVTDWNPLTVWFYKESYLRICSQEFCWDTMHESVHLSNVAIQQFYVNGERSSQLPDDNYLSSERFIEYLTDTGNPKAWNEIIYPGMKNAVVNTLLATMDVTENRKAAFELYGADFMLSESFTPWLLEINSSPGMAPSSKEKAKLCANVVEDLMKVVLDRRESKACTTGGFEMVYRNTPMPTFKCLDNKMFIEGNRIKRLDLQRYASLDHIIKSGDDPSKTDFLKEKLRVRIPRPPAPSREASGRPGVRPETNSNNNINNSQSVTRGNTRINEKVEQMTRSYTKIYARPLVKEASKKNPQPRLGEQTRRDLSKTAKRYEKQDSQTRAKQGRLGDKGRQDDPRKSKGGSTASGRRNPVQGIEKEEKADDKDEDNDYDDDYESDDETTDGEEEHYDEQDPDDDSVDDDERSSNGDDDDDTDDKGEEEKEERADVDLHPENNSLNEIDSVGERDRRTKDIDKDGVEDDNLNV